MLRDNEASNLMEKILTEKIRLEGEGRHPKVVVLGEKLHDLIEKDWVESVRELPWGDTLCYEFERAKEKGRNVFLGDGAILGLWVIRVDTIEDFEVR